MPLHNRELQVILTEDIKSYDELIIQTNNSPLPIAYQLIEGKYNQFIDC